MLPYKTKGGKMSKTYIETLKETRQRAFDLETKITSVIKQMYEQTEKIMEYVFQKLDEQASNLY